MLPHGVDSASQHQAMLAKEGGGGRVSWRSAGGLTLQLEPCLAAFISDMSLHENCIVDVCTSGKELKGWLKSVRFA